MKERPILLTAQEITAILEGRKTQLRRVIKSQPVLIADAGKHSTYSYCGGLYALDMYKGDSTILEKCPIGKIVDHLWVRETWSGVNLYGEIALAYKADCEVIRVVENESFQDDDGLINYDDPRLEKHSFAVWADDLLDGKEGCWKPPIQMPRWASRIVLEITNLRIERLNDISEADAIAEGMEADDEYCAEEYFSMQWSRSNGWSWKGWNANPWVWVIDFRVIEGGLA